MSGLTTADLESLERETDGREITLNLTVQLNAYAHGLLQLLTAKINADSDEKFTPEQVAAQMILRELRKVRVS